MEKAGIVLGASIILGVIAAAVIGGLRMSVWAIDAGMILAMLPLAGLGAVGCGYGIRLVLQGVADIKAASHPPGAPSITVNKQRQQYIDARQQAVYLVSPTGQRLPVPWQGTESATVHLAQRQLAELPGWRGEIDDGLPGFLCAPGEARR